MLVAVAEEKHDRVLESSEIDPDPGTGGDPKLLNAAPDRAEVAEVPCSDPREPLPDPPRERSVSQPSIPLRERLDAIQPSVEANLLLSRHGRTVA